MLIFIDCIQFSVFIEQYLDSRFIEKKRAFDYTRDANIFLEEQMYEHI